MSKIYSPPTVMFKSDIFSSMGEPSTRRDAMEMSDKNIRSNNGLSFCDLEIIVENILQEQA